MLDAAKVLQNSETTKKKAKNRTIFLHNYRFLCKNKGFYHKKK